jgi:serine/threonine protein kinase
MAGEARLADLLLQWEDLYEQGPDVPAERLCRDCPELVPPLAERIAALKRLAWINKPEKKFQKNAGATPREAGQPPAAGNKAGCFRPGAEPIPGYRLIRKLGKGGFGEVWSAQSSSGLVAIKFLHAHFDLPFGTQRALLEIQGLSRIRSITHPSIIRIQDVQVYGSTVALVTELAEASLEAHFQEPRWIVPNWLSRCARALEFLHEVADALDYLHVKCGLMHLDVKPANLLLVEGRCKIGDFGTVSKLRAERSADMSEILIAPSTHNPDESITSYCRSRRDVPWGQAVQKGATLFTAEGAFSPYYAPPEAFFGMVSRSFDQYSLALTFCELVSGVVPFRGCAEAQVSERLDGRVELGFLPEPLRAPISKALSPQPEQRFSSCSALIRALHEALRSYQDGRPLLADGFSEISFRMMTTILGTSAPRLVRNLRAFFSLIPSLFLLMICFCPRLLRAVLGL